MVVQPVEQTVGGGEAPHEVADEVARRLVARHEQEHELRARLDVGEPPSVDLALQQHGDEVVARFRAPQCDLVIDIRGELGVRARQPLAALVAVLRGVGTLHHLVGPLRPQVEVGAGRAEQVGDHARRDRHDVLTHEVDRTRAGQHRVEQVGAEGLAEVVDTAQAVGGDGAVDDAPHLAVTRLGDLVDELLLVGHQHPGLTEARVVGVEVLRGREHVVVAGEEPHAGLVAPDDAVVAEPRHPLVVGRGLERVEVELGRHRPIVRRPLASCGACCPFVHIR